MKHSSKFLILVLIFCKTISLHAESFKSNSHTQENGISTIILKSKKKESDLNLVFHKNIHGKDLIYTFSADNKIYDSGVLKLYSEPFMVELVDIPPFGSLIKIRCRPLYLFGEDVICYFRFFYSEDNIVNHSTYFLRMENAKGKMMPIEVTLPSVVPLDNPNSLSVNLIAPLNYYFADTFERSNTNSHSLNLSALAVLGASFNGFDNLDNNEGYETILNRKMNLDSYNQKLSELEKLNIPWYNEAIGKIRGKINFLKNENENHYQKGDMEMILLEK
jgi:hypothetical protein